MQYQQKLRHLKTGGEYTFISHAYLGTKKLPKDYSKVYVRGKLGFLDEPEHYDYSARAQISSYVEPWSPYIVYYNQDSGYWIRPVKEFEGRFECIT